MTIATRAVGTFANSTTTTLALVIPAGAQVGDVLYMFAAGPFGSTLPAGWTQLDLQTGVNMNGMIAKRTTVGGDPGATVNVTQAGTSTSEGVIVAMSGTAPAEAAVGFRSATLSTAVANTGLFAGIALYFAVVRVASTTVSLAVGSVDTQRAADTVVGGVIGHQSISAAGSSGQTFTASPSGNAGYYAAVVSVYEAASVPTAALLDPAAPSATNATPQQGGTMQVLKGHGTAVLDTSGAP